METEDTQTCSKTDAAAVTRKRRSSILKNQRPPRTPFSEVEFNVATPPDTTKSRRVSFSRRTGVAEFVTNEATTTWRNFYEEHNKSLESSGNENNLAENTPRQTIEHIGKRMFDQQFEEVEAVDLGGTIHVNPLQQFQASFNKINLTQELASLECMTDDLKFVPSQSKFEQSALTELSKPFGNDIQCPVLDDMTNPISMNFTMQPLSSSKCDDLDEIQNDLERSKPSGLCPGPMNPGKDFSGYIEVADLDITHGVIHNDGSEMSITDTIESPKVQDAAKNSIQQSRNKIDEDWTNDKENMVFNPYVAPKESLTFAVNKVSDEVLVFDGKRLTTQSITSDMPEKKENFRQTLLPNALAKAPQRKTIILDVNNGLPNFIDNNSSKSSFNLHVSSIQPADNVMAVDKENKSDAAGHNKSIANDTIDMCDTSNMLSFTQAISSNIIAAKRESLHAKHYHDMVQDISMTQPLPNNIIQMNEENILQTDNNEKRRTIIFAGDSCDISLTQVLQSNKNFNSENVSAKNGNTIIFDNDAHDISMTQALPTNINVNILDDLNNLKNKGEKDASSDKRKTIVFDEDSCNISMTQAVPVNIIGVKNQSNNVMGSKDLNSEKRRTIIFDHESCDISMTQALPSNINVINENKEVNYNIVDENLLENKNPVKRQTIIFDKESCEISMTQILPTNIKINDNIDRNNEFGKNIVNNDKSDKRRTIIFDKDSCDISVTQALPTNINLIENLEIDENIMKIEKSEKHRTIIFDKNSCDISMTQVLPTNINLIEILKKNDEDNKVPNENTEKLRKNIFEKESCDISMTKVLPTNIKENTEKHSKVSNEILEKSKTIIFDKNSFDISMTQAISSNINFEEQDNIKQFVLEDNVSKEISTKRKTIIFDQESCDISMTQALPTNINIFRDSLDKDESDIKLELKNATGIVNDNITDEKLTVRANTPQEPNTNDSKNVNHLSTTEIYDDNCKSSDQTDQLKIEKIDKTQNSEMNLCKTVQPNSFMHQDDQNAKLNTSLSNSTCHENRHVKETSYSRVNISKMDTECNDFLISDGVNLPLRNKSNLSYFNKETIDQTSQYITYQTDFKTNISTYYQVDTNKEMNKSSIEICNDELVEKMDVDKSIKLFKNKTIDGSLRDNTISNIKSGQKNSILNELLSMSTESVKEDLSKLDNKEDIVNRTEIKNENSILISTLNEPNCKESFPVENILAYDKNEPDVEIKSNDSVIFMEDQANRNHTNECIKNNDSREQSNADEDAKDKSYKQDHSKFNMELEESVKFISESNSTKTFKSVKEADNTKDLLKMLSDITDEDGDESIVKQEEFNAKNIDTQKPLPVEKNTIETKGIIEPKRLSLAPRRQSIAISREDLLNNISMAKAALQQSRFEVDETEIMDDTSELIETHEINDTHKSNRMSSEVVKTLQFEDESASDTSCKSEIRMTPLRKSANDEITSMYDKKAKVIPTLLTDVSVSLKELMHDLVKPNSDAPFETNFSEMNVPSTCNVEVEANLVTSSQIDVSQKDPTQCVLKNSDSFLSKSETKNVGLEVDSVILLNDIKSSVTDFKPTTTVQHTIDQNNKNLIDNIVKWNVNDKIQTSPPKSKHQSIVFDTDNPLKNIILPPIDYSNAHRYNQLKEEKDDDDTANKSRKPYCKMIELDAKSSDLTDRSFENDLLKEKKITEQMNIVCGQSSSKRADISDSNDSIMKLTNIDKSVNSIVPNICSSTLIHERITDGELEMNIEPSMEPLKETDIVSSKIAPVKILFRNENDTKLTEKDPDAWSSDEICKVDLDAKTRKRSYSPTSANSHVASNVEVTPKPISKMQKMSNSPLNKSTNHTNDNEVMQVDEEEAKSPKCDKSTINSAARTEIVQKVDIHYNSYCKSKSKPQILQSSKVDEEKILQSKECSKQLSFSSESIQEPSATISQIVSSVTSRILTSEEEARNVDTDAGPDVIDAIKSLSFMGTSECDWERRARDAWCFRLLCGRVRLRVSLHNAAVSACTPVTAVEVEIAKADARDPIAGMCVSLAVEAMRYEAAEVPRADAVAALLRRCVRVARLARRWARAMRDAHARLAYNVLPDGHISLKVANLPLRRVVEARLHVSLAVGRERGAAYPCADRLTLAAQEAGPGAGPDLARLADQPPDWGHVPRTIWKVFKYLKNRTRTEELLGV